MLDTSPTYLYFFIVPCYYITLFGCLWALFYTFISFLGLTTNRRPSPYCCFFPISVFQRKGISNGVQTDWNLREHDFWNERDLEDLECKSRSSRGGHERIGHLPCLVGPSGGHRRTSSSYIYLHTPKTSRSTTKHNFHCRNLLYPRDPILEPSPALRRRGNRPRRASTSTP